MLCLISGAIHYRIKASNWNQLGIRAAFKKLFLNTKSLKVKMQRTKHTAPHVGGSLPGGSAAVLGTTWSGHPPCRGCIPGGSWGLHSHGVLWLTFFPSLVRNTSASLFLPEFPLGTELVNSCCTKNSACTSPWQPLSLPWLSMDPKGSHPRSRCLDL